MKHLYLLSLFAVFAFDASAQNVGINFPAPPYPLTIKASTLLDSTKGIGISQQDVAGLVRIGFYTTTGAGAFLQTHSNSDLNFTTNGAGAQVTLQKGTGYLGIATPAPLAPLHVSGPATEKFRLENTTALNLGIRNELYFKTGTYFTGGIKTIGTATDAARLGFFTNAGTGSTALVERLTILDGGNVGIGKSDPSAKLEVNGTMKITDGTQAAGKLLESDATGLATWVDKSASLLPTGVSGNTLRHTGVGWTANSLLFNNGTNIGIGTAAPGYILDINGRARLRHNGITSGMWYNKADNTEAAFVGMFNDTTFGFYGGNGWSSGFDLKNNLLGVGVLNPTAPLSFPNSIGNKIALWGDATGGHYGMGIQGSLFQMYSSDINADIAFGYGSSTAFTEKMRIKGNGNVGIGAAPLFGKLDVRELTNANSTAVYIGVNNTLSSNSALRVESISGTTGRAILAYRQGTGNALLASSTHGEVINADGGTSPGDIAVKGSANNGVWGLSSSSSGIGVRASNGGFSSATALWAQGYSFTSGNLDVIGTLSKSAGSFKIDHPQDPQNKFLIHSFVESPDMMNVYNGNISTDNNGFATITLPAYFEALNIDFKYQLTIVGKEFAQALVYEKIKNNQFIVRSDKPNIEVSWQVTGVRNDKYAQQNRIVPEVEKSAKQKGKYQNAAAYGGGEEKQITPLDK